MASHKIQVCETTLANPEKVDIVRKGLPAGEEVFDIAETFKVLGDPTRLRILFALALEELCVCDLAALNNLSVSAISHQLRSLRAMKLVKYRKEGKNVFYSLDDDHVRDLIREAHDHVHH